MRPPQFATITPKTSSNGKPFAAPPTGDKVRSTAQPGVGAHLRLGGCLGFAQGDAQVEGGGDAPAAQPIFGDQGLGKAVARPRGVGADAGNGQADPSGLGQMIQGRFSRRLLMQRSQMLGQVAERDHPQGQPGDAQQHEDLCQQPAIRPGEGEEFTQSVGEGAEPEDLRQSILQTCYAIKNQGSAMNSDSTNPLPVMPTRVETFILGKVDFVQIIRQRLHKLYL